MAAFIGSPVKWLTDSAYRALPVQERFLAWMASYVGQMESGKNSGPFVTMILKAVGLPAGSPWCASLVSYCLIKAGYIGGPTSGRAAVRSWLRWADHMGFIRLNPRRGDLAFVMHTETTGHIGAVTKVNEDGSFEFISGNTNDAGSREGDGVYRKTVKGGKYRFIRWWV